MKNKNRKEIMSLAPYIGITDFTCYAQVEGLLKVFRQHKLSGLQRKLHVGVMMSYKTLNGIPSRFTNVFPPKESIAEIFRSEEAYNCLHYADYEHNRGFCHDLAQAIEYGGRQLHAVQLDMVLPHVADIAAGKHLSGRGDLEVILQIGKNVFEAIENNPNELVERLLHYEGAVDRVLLDKSMGRGVPLDAEALVPFVRAIKQQIPELGIGVAGGIGPTTTHLVESIFAEWDDISTDSQGAIRPSGSFLDPVDWSMAEECVRKLLFLCN